MSQYDMSAFKKKIAPRKKEEIKKNAASRFQKADEALGVNSNNSKLSEDSTKRKSIETITFSIPSSERMMIAEIKDKALDKKIVLSTSEVIRLALLTLSQVSSKELEYLSSKIEKISVGRPKKIL